MTLQGVPSGSWTELRLARQRVPHLRRRVPLRRIEYCWAGIQDGEQARAVLSTLRAQVAQLPREVILEEDSREPGDKN